MKECMFCRLNFSSILYTRFLCVYILYFEVIVTAVCYNYSRVRNITNLSIYLSISNKHAMRQITILTGGTSTSKENYAIDDTTTSDPVSFFFFFFFFFFDEKRKEQSKLDYWCFLFSNNLEWQCQRQLFTKYTYETQ